MPRTFACLVCLCIILVALAVQANPPSPTEQGAPAYRICGIVFPQATTLLVTAARLPSSFAKNRVNQERYEACPYRVTIRFNGIAIPVDFSHSTNLEDVLAVEREGGELHFGAWNLESGRWRLNSEVFDDSQYVVEPTRRGIKGGLLLYSVAIRRPANQPADLPDYCFHLTWIGRSRWSAGMACNLTQGQITELVRFAELPFALAPN